MNRTSSVLLPQTARTSSLAIGSESINENSTLNNLKKSSALSPRPRATIYAGVFNASVHKIKAICRRVICVVKGCALTSAKRAEKCERISISIIDLITTKYEFTSWPGKLNAMCEQAEDHAMDIPQTVYAALEKVSSLRRQEILKCAATQPSLRWLAVLIEISDKVRFSLENTLSDALSKSCELFEEGSELSGQGQANLWISVQEKCQHESMRTSDSDLLYAIKKVCKGASLNKLAPLINFYTTKNYFDNVLIFDLTEKAVEELKSYREAPLSFAWSQLEEHELKPFGELIKLNDFSDWKDNLIAGRELARLQKIPRPVARSNYEILEELEKCSEIGTELRVEVEQRIDKLHKESIAVLNVELKKFALTGSSGNIFQALVTMCENEDAAKKFESIISKISQLDFNDLLDGIAPESHASVLAYLTQCGEIVWGMKLNKNEISAPQFA